MSEADAVIERVFGEGPYAFIGPEHRDRLQNFC